MSRIALAALVTTCSAPLNAQSEDDCVCRVGIHTAEVPAVSDGFGRALAVSPDSQRLYVTALGRPGIPNEQVGAIDVFALEDGCIGARLSTIDPLMPQHAASFGTTMVPLSDGLFVGSESLDAGGFVDTGEIYWCTLSANGEWQAEPLGQDNQCQHRRLGSTIAANETRMIACENNCDGPTRRVLVFDRSGDEWRFSDHIETPSQDVVPCEGVCWSSFGNALAVGSDFVVVATSNSQTDAGPNAGRVNIFKQVAGVWTHDQQLLPRVSEQDASFGAGVLLADDDTLFVAASYDFSFGFARLYRFDRDKGGIWSQSSRIDIEVDSLTSAPQFGQWMTMSPDGRTLIVSAHVSDLPGETPGVLYEIDIETEAQRIVRYMDNQSVGVFRSPVFLSDELVAVGETSVVVEGNEFAGRVVVYDLSSFVHCPADLDRDGTVGGPDVVQLFQRWNTPVPEADLDCSGAVEFNDLIAMLSNWGECLFVPPGAP